MAVIERRQEVTGNHRADEGAGVTPRRVTVVAAAMRAVAATIQRARTRRVGGHAAQAVATTGMTTVMAILGAIPRVRGGDRVVLADPQGRVHLQPQTLLQALAFACAKPIQSSCLPCLT